MIVRFSNRLVTVKVPPCGQASANFWLVNKDALVMLDADGTYDPAQIPEFVSRLENNDVVIGDRLRGNMEPGAMTRVNYFGNHMLTWIASALYGVNTNDLFMQDTGDSPNLRLQN